MNCVVSRNVLWLLGILSFLSLGACVVGTGEENKCNIDADCQGATICFRGRCVPGAAPDANVQKEPAVQETSQETNADNADAVGTPEGNGGDDAAVQPEPPQDVDPSENPAEEPSESAGEVGPETCVDSDGDGYCGNIPGDKGAIDCNDNDKNVYPGAKELCNGIDDDCNGQIDDNPEPEPCSLQDGVCKGAVKTECDGTNGWKPCSETVYASHSNSTYEKDETTCDGLDNDCDGQTDETFGEKDKACQIANEKGECAKGLYTKCERGRLVCETTYKQTTEICFNNKDDDCDGSIDETPPCTCRPGTTRECYTGTLGCAVQSGKYTCQGLCKAGTQTCKSDSSWGACTGEVVSAAEVCDGDDNDCDGQVDESFPEQNTLCLDASKYGPCAKGLYTVCTAGKPVCSTKTQPKREICYNKEDDDCDGKSDEDDCESEVDTGSSSITDYAVTTDGTYIVLFSDSRNVRVACFGRDGTTKKATFNLATYTYRVYNQTIIAAKTANMAVISWTGANVSGQYRMYSQVVDANCANVGNRITWPSPQLNSSYPSHDVAIADNGNFAIAYTKANKLYVSFYNKSGVQIGAESEVDPTGNKCRDNYGIRIAMNATGAGVVSCQQSSGSPIYYRTFSALRVFAGTDMVKLTESESKSSYNVSHIIGINDNGHFAIYWQYVSMYRNELVTFSNAGAKLKQVTVTKRVGSGRDGFRFPGQRVEMLGNHFVVRDTTNSTSQPTTWYRYNKDGTLVAAATLNYRYNLLRVGADGKVYVSDGRKIYLGKIDLSAGKGLCSGQACLCKAGDTRSCYTGGSSARTPCKTGTQTCAASGLSWGACVGEVLPSPEKCGDSIDNDCDGRSDENCTTSNIIQPIGYIDMDAASSDGSLVNIFWTGQILRGSCFAADGSVKKASFDISNLDRGVSYARVRTAANGRFVVIWMDKENTSSSLGTWMARLFDKNCAPVGAAFALTAETNLYVTDVAIDSNGRMAFVYRDYTDKTTRLSFYDATGKVVKKGLKVDSTANNTHCVTNYTTAGLHVTVHPTSGVGIVTCSNYYTNPIYMRRFQISGTFTDSSTAMVANTDGRKSSRYRTHILGINSNGQFVIEWQNYTDYQFEANFYDASAQLVKHVVLSKRMYYNRDGFNADHQKVELLGNDFILRDGDSRTTPNFFRYNPNGGIVAYAIGEAKYDWNTFRAGGSNHYMYDSGMIYINPYDLAAGKGLCGGKVCVCKAGETRACYNGSNTTSPRTPCKAGTQTCATDGLSWGACTGEVLPQPEQCGDSKDNDCDGSVDEGCTTPNTVQTLGVTDYDVAPDGTIVTVWWNGKALLANCISAAGKIIGDTVVVSIPGEGQAISSRVRISASKIALISWLESSSRGSSTGPYKSMLLDATCKPIKTFTWPGGERSHYYFSTAIDANGNSALVWKDANRTKTYLSFYDNKGTKVGSDLDVNPNSNYCRSSGGIRVALNPSNGSGIVTCQYYYSTPTYYRLFANRTLQGSEMTSFAPTASRNNSYWQAHIVGMNGSGQFMLFWQDRTNSRFRAAFYGATGTLGRNIAVSSTMRYNYEAFNTYRENVVNAGNDFIVRDGGFSPTSVTWYRYTAAGTLIGKAAWPSTSYRFWGLRFGNNKIHLLNNNNTIYIGTITFQ